MDMLENKDTQKRRRPPVKALVLAAALAVGCVLSIAAGLPAQVYNFMTGGTLVITPAGDGVIGGAEMTVGGVQDEPIILEDGKLWFISGGERTDITHLIDENTPYIHEHTDPATGNKGYVIVGGTIDDYGWAELFMTKDGTCSMMGDNAWDFMVPVDGKPTPLSELTEEQLAAVNGDSGAAMDTVNRPWLDKAIEQLGLIVD